MKPPFSETATTAPLLLTEGAVVERLRRDYRLPLDAPTLHAAFIYDDRQRSILEQIFSEYIALLKPAGVPFILFTPTWRANKERCADEGRDTRIVNRDNVRFLRALRSGHPDAEDRMYIGGLMGCRGDAYRPEEALSVEEAGDFHQMQAEALMDAGADFLMASTLPAVSEAEGMARAISSVTAEYILSFIVRPDGTLLDGTPLHDALGAIDTRVRPAPLAYMINCVHPSVFRSAVDHPSHSSVFVRSRIIGLQANTSAKTPEELDRLQVLDTADAEPFAREMDALRTSCGTRLLGGCCGTDGRHIAALARRVTAAGSGISAQVLP